MQQRESLPVPFAPEVFKTNGKIAVAAIMGKYFLDQQLTDSPLAFLNKDGAYATIDMASGYANKLDKEAELSCDNVFKKLVIHDTLNQIPTEGQSDLTLLICEFLVFTSTRNALCIISFTETGNTLCIVGGGSSKQYYAIDLANRIFCITTGPEWDVPAYGEQYGGAQGTFHATFWIHSRDVPTPTKKEPVETEPKPKKIKTTESVQAVEAEEEAVAQPTKPKRKKVVKKAVVAPPIYCESK